MGLFDMAGKLRAKDEPRQAPVPRMRHVSPLQRLISKEVLNVYEETAATEILAARHMMAGGAMPKADPDILPDSPRPGAADAGAARQSDLVRAFRQWRTALEGTEALRVVEGVLFQETSMRELERLLRIRNGGALAFLLQGLRHYAALRGNVPRGVRGWKFNQGADQ